MQLLTHTPSIVPPGKAGDTSTRMQIICILRHRINSLRHAPEHATKKLKLDKCQTLLNRFEHVSKASEEQIMRIVREVSFELIYLYGPETKFKTERRHLLEICHKAHNE